MARESKLADAFVIAASAATPLSMQADATASLFGWSDTAKNMATAVRKAVAQAEETSASLEVLAEAGAGKEMKLDGAEHFQESSMV